MSPGTVVALTLVPLLEIALCLVELYYLKVMGHLSLGEGSSQSELALWLVELYKLSRPTLFFIPLKSDLKWLNYVQLSPGTVVPWAIVTQIRASVVTG